MMNALQSAQQAFDAAVSSLQVEAHGAKLNVNRRRATKTSIPQSAWYAAGARVRPPLFRLYTVALFVIFGLFKLLLHSQLRMQKVWSRLRYGRGKTLSGYAAVRAQRPRVVVLGGGYVGTYAAMHLEHDFRVCLIDSKDFFEFAPSRLRALVSPEHANKIRVRHREFLKHTELVQDWVVSVGDSQVYLQGRQSAVPFDYLIIATGSRYGSTKFESIPDYLARCGKALPTAPLVTASLPHPSDKENGTYNRGTSDLVQHGPPVDGFVAVEISDLSSSVGLRRPPATVISARADEIEECYEAICAAATVLVVGGGTVGVEMIGELVERFNGGSGFDQRRLGHEKRVDLVSPSVDGENVTTPKRLILVHSQERVMQRSPESAIEYTEDYFAAHNVEVILCDRVVAQYGDEFLTQMGLRLQADVVIMCTGNIPNSEFLRNSRFESHLAPSGAITVDPHMRLPGTPNIFVAGDITHVENQGEKLCQTGYAEAKVCIANIHALETGQELEHYVIEHCPMLISLGKYDALLTYRGYTVTGFIPSLMKEFVEWKELVYYWDLGKFTRKKNTVLRRDRAFAI